MDDISQQISVICKQAIQEARASEAESISISFFTKFLPLLEACESAHKNRVVPTEMTRVDIHRVAAQAMKDVLVERSYNVPSYIQSFLG